MKKAVSLLVGLMAAAVLFSCVPSNELKDLQLKVAQQDEKIKSLSGHMAETQPAQAEMWTGVQTMRSDVAAMKGTVDNLQSQMNAFSSYPPNMLVEDVARMKTWWRQLDSQMALNLDWSSKPAMPVAHPGGFPGDAYAPGRVEADFAPGSDQAMNTLGAMPATDQALYNAALESFRNREYDKALSIWEQYVQTYPNNELVPQAWFWQGESLYQQSRFNEAILRYQEVVEKYPKSPKYPAALLKQGVSFTKIGKDKAGRLLLEDLIKRFPNSPEAQQARTILAKPTGKN